MVDIWYPAEPSNAVPADYLDAAAYEKAIGADGFQKFWCFRNRLLVAGSQPVVAKALAIDFEVAGSCGAKFDRNLLLPNILDWSQQQLMTEAPGFERDQAAKH
jgi:hypothetical protein